MGMKKMLSIIDGNDNVIERMAPVIRKLLVLACTTLISSMIMQLMIPIYMAFWSRFMEFVLPILALLDVLINAICLCLSIGFNHSLYTTYCTFCDGCCRICCSFMFVKVSETQLAKQMSVPTNTDTTNTNMNKSETT